MAAERRGSDRDDLLTQIVNARSEDGEKLSPTELLDFFSVLLLGGIDNTARFLGTVFWRLARDHTCDAGSSRAPT